MRRLVLLLCLILLTGCSAGAVLSHDQFNMHTIINDFETAVASMDQGKLAAIVTNPARINSVAATSSALVSTMLPGLTKVDEFRIGKRVISRGQNSASVTGEMTVAFLANANLKKYTIPVDIGIINDRTWKISGIYFELPDDWPHPIPGEDGELPLPPPSNPNPGADANDVLDRFLRAVVSKRFFDLAPFLNETVGLINNEQSSYMTYRRFIDLLDADFNGVEVIAAHDPSVTVLQEIDGRAEAELRVNLVIRHEQVRIESPLTVKFDLVKGQGGWYIERLDYRSRVWGLL